jgi:hypothetical protein
MQSGDVSHWRRSSDSQIWAADGLVKPMQIAAVTTMNVMKSR